MSDKPKTPLTSGAIPPRPFLLTDDRQHTIAGEMADRLIRAGELEAEERDEIILDLIKCGMPDMDGYELAKALDDRCYWSSNMDIAEILDGWAPLARRELAVMEAEWFRFWNVQPEHAPGTRIKLARGEIGVIEGVSPYGVAKYSICLERDAHGKTPTHPQRIVKFEDVTAIIL